MPLIRDLGPLALLPALFLGLLLAGCGKGTPTGDANANAAEKVKPIVKTAEIGPVKMTVTADKDRITIAERLKLTIEVVAQEGVDIELPEYVDQFNEFQVRGFQARAAEAVAGGRRWARTYDLDVFLSGEYSIPELEAKFIDRRRETSAKAPGTPTSQPGEGAEGDSGVKEGTLRTEPLTITVTSLLEGTFDPTKFRDIKGAVELPVPASRRWLLWGGGVTAGVIVAAVVLLFVWRRRRRRGAEQLAGVPHEWAFDQLRLLIDDRLVEQGRVQEFYFRLSHIVRTYIEMRFGLMAPERTTEEFLVEVQRSSALRSDHKGLLGDFLQACDMVKFAKYEPSTAEIEAAFNAARVFIEQTAPQREEAMPQVREEAA